MIALLLASLVLAHSIWDYAENRRLRARLDAIVQRGEPILAGRYVQLSEGAARSERLYRAAAALAAGSIADPPTFDSRLSKALRDGQWPADVVEFARSVLDRNAEALAFVDRAAALPFDSFEPGAEYNFLTARLVWLSRLCELRAAIRALEGHADPAAESIFSDLRLARTLTGGLRPSITWLKPFAALPFVYGKTRPSAAMNARLGQALAELDRDDSIKQEVVRLRAQLLSGREREMRNLSWVAQPWFVHTLVHRLDIFSALVTAAERPPAERMDAILAVGEWPGPGPSDLGAERSRAMLEGFTKSLVNGIEALHCARRLVAGEVVDCHF